ncbi:hypothetical protein [Candidatus Nanohalococcus occultus]|uniref:hypothetical protein n=1 Tax=Candidatus Nanohalococcus occultus TaxID=2978047 RepID=UPI0039E0AC25
MNFRDNRLGDLAKKAYQTATSSGEDRGEQETLPFSFIEDEEVQSEAVGCAKRGNYEGLAEVAEDNGFSIGEFASDYINALETVATSHLDRAHRNEKMADKFLEKAEDAARRKADASSATDRDISRVKGTAALKPAKASIEYLCESDPENPGQVQDRRTAFKTITMAKNFASHYGLEEKVESYDSLLDTMMEKDRQMGMNFGRKKAGQFNQFSQFLSSDDY